MIHLVQVRESDDNPRSWRPTWSLVYSGRFMHPQLAPPSSDQPAYTTGGRGSTEGRGRGGRSGGLGGRGGRGGRQGRGDMEGDRRNSEGEDGGSQTMDYTHQASSEENQNARKRLVHADGSVNVRGQGLPNLSGKVAKTVLYLESGGEDTHQVTSTTPGRNPIVKRRKQDGRRQDEDEELDDKAASLEEDRRAQ